MRYALILLSVILTSIASYPTDYDDYDKFKSDPEVVRKAMECLIDEGVCDGIAEFYKPHVSEIISTACAYCNDKQKTLARDFFNSIKSNYPDLLKPFAEKYDPERKYIPEFLKTIGV